MIAVTVTGPSLLDLADEITEEAKPRAIDAAKRGSVVLRDAMQGLLHRRRGAASLPGEPPAEELGNLARAIRTLSPRAVGRAVVAGVAVGGAEDIEKVQSLEFGAVGPNGRILLPRPFMRPAEAASEAEITAIFESVL